MSVKEGSKCQAVDENGSWEAAVVKKRTQDGSFLVSFVGWPSEFDRVVTEKQIRTPLPPYHKIEPCSQRKGTEWKKNDLRATSLLKSIVSDDTVHISGRAVKVYEIDRFARCLTILGEDGEQKVSIYDLDECQENEIQEKEENINSYGHMVKRQRKACEKSLKVPSTKTSEVSVQKSSEPCIYMWDGKIVGHIYQMKDLNCHVAIRQLNMKGIANGCLVCNRKVWTDTQLTLPVVRLGREGLGLKDVESQFSHLLETWKKEAHESTSELLKDIDKAKEFRENQLVGFIKNEIYSALCGRSLKKNFTVGPVQPGELPSIQNDVITFGYKDSHVPLRYLDKLFGDRWDVVPDRVGHRFITAIKFRRRKDWVMTASLALATCLTSLSPNYRETLQNDIACTRDIVEDREMEDEVVDETCPT